MCKLNDRKLMEYITATIFKLKLCAQTNISKPKANLPFTTSQLQGRFLARNETSIYYESQPRCGFVCEVDEYVSKTFYQH